MGYGTANLTFEDEKTLSTILGGNHHKNLKQDPENKLTSPLTTIERQWQSR